MLSKKAQVSIEVLTILSILVIGSIIFGVYYLSTVRKNIDVVAGFDSPPNLYVEDPYGIGPTEEPITPPLGQFAINLSLDPDTFSAPNIEFEIIVELSNLINIAGNMYVTQIDVKNKDTGFSSSDCYYNGAQISGGTLSGLNINIGDSNNDTENLTFSCSTDGNYTFTISVGGIDLNGINRSASADIDKEITSSTPPVDLPDLQLYLNPEESTPQGVGKNKRFGIDVNLSNFTAGPPVIKKIQVFETADNNKVDVCYYGDNKIGNNGYTLTNVLMNQVPGVSNQYSYLLNDISCSQAGDYYIFITAGESSNTNNDINAPIIKTISSLSATLSLVPDGNSQVSELFGINVFVDNYNLNSAYNINENKSRIQVTRISVVDANTGQPTEDCYYNFYRIEAVGFEILGGFNLTQTPNSNDYNGKIDNIRCISPGTYNFTFTVHDSKENKIYDYNATIPKIIHNVYFDRCKDVFTTGDIRDASELDCVRYYLSRDYKLVNDIDLNHALLSSDSTATWYDDENGWLPIGTLDAAFTGNFNGNGKTISNLYSKRNSPIYSGGSIMSGGVANPYSITGDAYNSLFLVINEGKIYDLNIADVNLGYGYTAYMAAPLAAYAINSKFTDINVSGVIYSTDFTGGLVSYAKDSNFESISFDGKINFGYLYGGGIIGAAENITLNNSHVVADINGLMLVGGLIGGSSPLGGGTSNLISNSYSIVNIGGRYNDSYALPASHIGGLVGGGQFIILNSFSDVNIVNAYAEFGGLCGWCNSIINSYATGNIIVDQNTVGGMSGSQLPNYLPVTSGGLAGLLQGTAINSYFVGNITLTPVSKISTPPYTTFEGWATNIGGLVGVVEPSTFETGVANCYSRANITINGNVNRIGGLIGILNARDVNDSYYTGNLNISGTSNTHIGGLIGKKEDTSVVNYSYWNTQTSGYSSSAGGLGRTTTQMTYPDYPDTYSGWDFSNLWIEDTENINNDYPYLNPAYVGDYDIYFDPPALTPSQQAILQIQNNTWAQNSLNTEGMAN